MCSLFAQLSTSPFFCRKTSGSQVWWGQISRDCGTTRGGIFPKCSVGYVSLGNNDILYHAVPTQ